MAMKIKPLGDRVLIESIDEDTFLNKTKSGIIIPETVDKERPEMGKVIEVGPGRLNDNDEIIPVQVKKGQVVIFSKYGPDEIKIDGKEYYVLKETDIIAIVEKK